MNREDVFAYLGGCFHGEPASCSYACPFRLDLRAFLKKLAKGRFDAAYKDLAALIPFPEIVCRICPQPCRGACQCSTVLGGESIEVRTLERACVDYAKRREPTVYAVPPKAERIAVVGAGLAGLSLALTLLRKKYQVTVFEKEAAYGGDLSSFDDAEELCAAIEFQFSKEKPEFVFNREIASLDELADFDAVFLATGADGADFGLKESWNSELYYTSAPGVFLGGALVGLDTVEGMAAAVRAARSIEAYLQTKNPENAAEAWDMKNACRYVPHDGTEPSPATKATGENGRYTAEEAKTEAARCMQCSCDGCMQVCELMQKYKKAPPRVASDVLLDGESRNSVSTAAITRETWSCNLCGRCAEKCSEQTDVGGMLQISRARRVEGNLYPPAIHSYWLREMDFAAGEGALTIPGEGNYVFFPGCRLGAVNPDYVLKSYALLRETQGAGLVLNCCGIPAYWAGEQKMFEAHLAALRGIWEQLGKPTFVLACASCGKVFSHWLPEIPVISLYELLPPECAVKPGEIREAAVFDPCAAAKFPEMQQAVRGLTAASGAAVSAFSSDGKCCGFGGHMQLANPALYRQIVENRTAETELPYVAYCTNCRETFRAAGKESLHVLDLYFGLQTGDPTLEEKRRNSIVLKKTLMEHNGMGTFAAETKPWDALNITVSVSLAAKMDGMLIPLRDVKQVIYRAEERGTGFANAAGELLVCGELEAVTVWAKVKKLGENVYELLDVYSHRMRVGKGES